ncbi:MAG: hypothetical protein COB15_02355 [Flavobacteriales bacterium]|nr:MAG: hypothetical protein COB15_02355 [Flavobacteriales bacterium]
MVCPLDWSLGHATRCVPIINELLRLGNHGVIGADKNPLAFLKQEYLANYHYQQGSFYRQKQNEFDLEKGMVEVEKFFPREQFRQVVKLKGFLK